jgi:hypothetical protein
MATVNQSIPVSIVRQHNEDEQYVETPSVPSPHSPAARRVIPIRWRRSPVQRRSAHGRAAT